MRLMTTTQVSVDGVMQANGGRHEEPDPYDAYYCHWSRVRKGELPAAGDLGLAWTQRLVAMNTLVVSNTLLNAGDDVTFQTLIGDEFRAARRSHTPETTGRCIVRRRVRDERVASAI